MNEEDTKMQANTTNVNDADSYYDEDIDSGLDDLDLDFLNDDGSENSSDSEE